MLCDIAIALSISKQAHQGRTCDGVAVSTSCLVKLFMCVFVVVMMDFFHSLVLIIMKSMFLTLFPTALKGPLMKWLMLYQRIQSESEFTDARTVPTFTFNPL